MTFKNKLHIKNSELMIMEKGNVRFFMKKIINKKAWIKPDFL